MNMGFVTMPTMLYNYINKLKKFAATHCSLINNSHAHVDKPFVVIKYRTEK